MAQPTPAPSARGPYAKTADVRRRIVEACMDEFAATGYYAATLKDIAERAGISQRGLVHHFPSKQHLLEAVLARREERDAAVMPRVPDGIRTLLAMLEVMAGNRAQPGLVQLYSGLRAEATASAHPAHAHHRDQYAELRVYLSMTFEHIRSEGGLESTWDPDLLATTFLALSDGVQLQWLYDSAAVDPDGVLKAFLATHLPEFRPLAAGHRS